jgi:hypothetical protein
VDILSYFGNIYNSGRILADGGAGDATSGTGGDGGMIELESYGGA